MAHSLPVMLGAALRSALCAPDDTVRIECRACRDPSAVAVGLQQLPPVLPDHSKLARSQTDGAPNRKSNCNIRICPFRY